MLLHTRPCLWLLRVTRATPRLRVRAQVAARMLVARAVASRRGGCVGLGRPVSVALVVSEMHFADLRNRLQGQSQFGRVRIVARVGHWVEIWWSMARGSLGRCRRRASTSAAVGVGRGRYLCCLGRCPASSRVGPRPPPVPAPVPFTCLWLFSPAVGSVVAGHFRFRASPLGRARFGAASGSPCEPNPHK